MAAWKDDETVQIDTGPIWLIILSNILEILRHPMRPSATARRTAATCLGSGPPDLHKSAATTLADDTSSREKLAKNAAPRSTAGYSSICVSSTWPIITKGSPPGLTSETHPTAGDITRSSALTIAVTVIQSWTSRGYTRAESQGKSLRMYVLATTRQSTSKRSPCETMVGCNFATSLTAKSGSSSTLQQELKLQKQFIAMLLSTGADWIVTGRNPLRSSRSMSTGIGWGCFSLVPPCISTSDQAFA
mmetsp:Transcript_120712/g.191445  ORF Transcript_120712/g.191445 Transcript_120712/m.191445 type:complete len:246 (+) Transcript_120712:415-1152(+)